MADLLDIVPEVLVASVWINGSKLTVRGITSPTIAILMKRFPELGALIGSGSGGEFMKRLFQAGVAAGPIIAAGLGHLGDEKYEQAAERLLFEDQARIINAIFGLTFPNGIDPFIEAMNATSVAGKGEGAKMKFRSSKTSRSPSSPSSEQASHPTMQ